MWRSSLLVYFGLLALLALLAGVGGRLRDPGRELFDIFALASVVVLALMFAIYARSRARRANESKSAVDRSLPEVVDSTSPQANYARRSILVVAGTVLGLCVSWTCLIYLGTLGDDAQPIALANVQIATSILTAGAVIVLALFGPTAERSKVWMLRSAAIAMLFLQAIGLIVIPVIAMKLWRGHIDFSEYAHAMNLNWFYLTLAAVVFCFLRTKRPAPR